MPREFKPLIMYTENINGMEGKILLEYRLPKALRVPGESPRVRQRFEDTPENRQHVEKLVADLAARVQADRTRAQLFPEQFEEEKRRRAEVRDRPLFRGYVETYLDTYAKRLRDQRTVTMRLAKFTALWGDRHLDEVRRADVVRYQADRAEQVAEATVDRELAALKRLYNCAVADEVIARNPVAGVKFFLPDNERDRFFSDAEATRIIAACAPPLGPAVEFALATGLRRGELCGLTWEDVCLESEGAEHVLLPRSRTKAKKRQRVRLNETALAVLRGLRRGVGKAPVFTWPDGRPLNRDWITHEFREILVELEIPDSTFHTCRHTFASRLAQLGATTLDIKTALRHGSTKMAERYSHLGDDRPAKVVRLLDRRRGQEVANGQKRSEGTS